MSRRTIQLLILCVAVGTTGWAHSRVPHSTRAEMGGAFVPSPQVVSAATFGFDALLADYYWLQAIQVAGGTEAMTPAEAWQLGQLVDVVTTLNPHVGHPYRFAAVWLTHDVDQVREGIRLLERGIEYHPDDWRNHFHLSFNHFYYLAEYEEAARVLEIAVGLPGRPAYFPRLVARLKSQHSDIDVAEIFLREVLRSTQDEDARAKIQVALDEIEIEYKARHLDEARDAYRQAVGRDIETVDDLIQGPHRMIERLPSAEPDAIPAALARGSIWKIDAKTDRIVSSYLGKRYEVHYTAADRKRLEKWRQDSESVNSGDEVETTSDG